MKKEYAAVVIKPDSIRDILELMIINDLLDAGINVIWRKYWRISEDQVDLIYPAQMHTEIFPSTKKAMTRGYAMLLVVEGDDIHSTLKELKGKMDTGGIRLKYRQFSKRELIEQGYLGRKLMDILVENRIHTPDNLEESLLLCLMALNCQEQCDLKEKAPEFVSQMRRLTAIDQVK